jgi:ornithine cyclodeaminase
MLHLDFDRVHAQVSVKDLIAPMRRAFLAPPMSPRRNHYDLDGEGDGRTLLIMPAWRSATSIGVKVTTVFPGNTQRGLHSVNGSYLLLSAETGQPRALIDGRALTLLRTAAVSSLAADLLAPENSKVLLMVGTGALAKYLIEGHLSVRRYSRVLIWGRDPRKAAEIADQCQKLDFQIDIARDLEQAVRSADVISCATSSNQAIVMGAWLKPHAHVDLVGSFKPEMRETDDECMRHAYVTVDSMDALNESGDLLGPLQAGFVGRDEVKTLKEIIEENGGAARKAQSVFKSIGVALADLAAAEHLIALAS